MVTVRFGWVAALVLLVCTACGGDSTGQTLPTLAELESDTPTTAATTPPDNAVDIEPTPTRETTGGVTNTPASVPTANPGAGSDFDPNALNPFALNGAGFAADINGSETLRVAGSGGLRCGEHNTYVLESSAAGVPRLMFTFSRTITPGSYFMRDIVAEGIEVRPALTLASGEIYDSQLDGVFVLKTFATRSGANITGDFEYVAVSNADPTKSVLIRGGFNFPAPSLMC